MIFLTPLLVLFALFSAQPAGAQALEKIRITIPVPVLNFYPLYVAADKGFFAKEGYEAEIISTSGDGPDVDALISGSVQFTVSTPNRLFTAFEQGKPLLAVMNVVNRLAVECFMNKEIADELKITTSTPIDETITALKGYTVAGTRPGAFTYLVLQNYIKRVGLEPQTDIKLIGVGGPSSMIPAIENKTIAMGCSGSPSPEIAASRGKSIVATKNMSGGDPTLDNFLFALLYVEPEYAKQRPEVVRGVIRALRAAIAYIHDTPSAEQLPILRARFTGQSDEILVAALDTNRPTYKRDGLLTQEAVDKAAKFLRDAGIVKADIPWDAVATNEFNEQ